MLASVGGTLSVRFMGLWKMVTSNGSRVIELRLIAEFAEGLLLIVFFFFLGGGGGGRGGRAGGEGGGGGLLVLWCCGLCTPVCRSFGLPLFCL